MELLLKTFPVKSSLLLQTLLDVIFREWTLDDRPAFFHVCFVLGVSLDVKAYRRWLLLLLLFITSAAVCRSFLKSLIEISCLWKKRQHPWDLFLQLFRVDICWIYKFIVSSVVRSSTLLLRVKNGGVVKCDVVSWKVICIRNFHTSAEITGQLLQLTGLQSAVLAEVSNYKLWNCWSGKAPLSRLVQPQCSKQGQLKQAAHGHVCLGFEYPQRWRLRSLSVQTCSSVWPSS